MFDNQVASTLKINNGWFSSVSKNNNNKNKKTQSKLKMDCLVTRPDGTTYLSRRKAKVKMTMGDGSQRLCTGLKHCCDILSNELEYVVTINHLYRRNPALLKKLDEYNISIEFLGKHAIPCDPLKRRASL